MRSNDPRLRRAVARASVSLALLLTSAGHAPAQLPPGQLPGQGGAAQQAPVEQVPGISAGAALLIVDPPGASTGLLPARATGPAPAAAADPDKLYQRRILTHAATLKTEHTIQRVLTNPASETRKTQWFKTGDNPLERSAWLREHLRVTAVPGTALIQVDLPDVRDPRERKTILEEVCQTYLDSTRRTQQDALLDRTAMLNNVKIKAEARLKDIVAEMRTKQIQLNVDGGGIGRVGVKELELSKLVSEQIDSQLRAGRARAALETLTAAAQGGSPIPASESAAESDPRVQELTRRLDEARLRADLARAKPGGDKAAAEEADAEAKVLSDHLQLRRAAVTARAKVSLLELAQARAAEETAQRDAISKKVEYLKGDLRELSNAMTSYYNLQEEQKGLREQLKAVKEQIENVMALQSSAAASDIRWHQMPAEAFPIR